MKAKKGPKLRRKNAWIILITGVLLGRPTSLGVRIKQLILMIAGIALLQTWFRTRIKQRWKRTKGPLTL